MSRVLEISSGERGRIRLFAINRPPVDMRSMLASAPKADVARQLLAAPHLATRSVEIFPVQDLEGVGLAQYLIDGYAVPAATLADDRAKLEALDGYVLLLFSDSFGGAATTLAPSPDVTLIGTYDETLADMRQRPTLTPSAAPYSGTPQLEPVTPPRGGGSRLLLVLALATGAGLLLWWLLR